MKQPGESAPKQPKLTVQWDEERVRQLERAVAVLAQILAEQGLHTDDEGVLAVVMRVGSQ